jgi:TolB protein
LLVASIAAVTFLVELPAQSPTAPPLQRSKLQTVRLADSWRTRASEPSVSVSADGRYVALASYVRLAPADQDDQCDIYVLDRTTGAVTLESVWVDGARIEGDNVRPRLSGDGRAIVFEAALGTSNESPGYDIVLRDRTRDTSTRIGRAARGGPPDGWSGNAAISHDGGIVVFTSTATNLVAEPDLNGSLQDVYLFRAATATITRVSVDSRGIQPAQGASFGSAVSPDGRYVAFSSTADFDAVPGDGRGDEPLPANHRMSQVYVRDTSLSVTRRISVTREGRRPDGASLDPVISRDGLLVAFVSHATNLTPGDRNRSSDVFLHDAKNGSTTMVSRNAAGGSANGASESPAISGDGRFVAFQSDASDLICARRCHTDTEDINLLADVFLFDRLSGTVTLVSADSAGWMEESGGPSLDDDASTIAFTSRHPIDGKDIGHDFDLFVHVSMSR